MVLVRMEKRKVAVIGCGNVGTQFAVFAAQRGYDLLLFDVVEGLAKGRELDLSQAQNPLGFESEIRAIESLDEALDADLWVITAGKPRKPGMSRADLAAENLKIIKGIAEMAKRASEKTVFLLVTNPLDIVVTKFVEHASVDRTRVLGMGGVLDSARMSYFTSLVAGVPAKEIEAWVLGAHSDSMVPCFSLTKIKGKPCEEFLSEEDKQWIREKTVNGGAEIVSFLKTGSAFIAPGASVYRLASAVLEAKKELLPVSVYAQGEYGFAEAAIGLPCEVSEKGINSVVELELDEEERRALEASFKEVKQFLKEI